MPPSYPGPQPPQYGAPTHQPGFQPQGDPNARPGTVTAAAWIAIVLSILGLLGSLGVMAATSSAVDYVIEHPEEFDVQSSDMPAAGDIRSVLTVFAAIFIVASVIAILTAFATLKRQGWGRILLVVMSTLAALVSILFSLVLIGLPWLAGSIAVIVLLFTNRANAWFRGGAQQP